jgi:hypothetical protein
MTGSRASACPSGITRNLANTTNPKDDHHHRDAAALSRATTELTAQNEAGQTIH